MEDCSENDFIRMWVEDDILHLLYKDGCILTLEAAKEIVAFRLSFQKRKTYNCLVYMNGIKSVKPAAKEYFSMYGYKGIDKMALVGSAAVICFLASLFILINKPVRPTKMFYETDDALTWLRS